MADLILIRVPMAPKGKVRARSNGAARFNDDAYKTWQTDFWEHARDQVRGMNWAGEFAMDCIFYTRTGLSRSDVDNAVGSILDLLQHRTQIVHRTRYVTEERLYANDKACMATNPSREVAPDGVEMIEVMIMEPVLYLEAIRPVRSAWRLLAVNV